MPPKGYKQSEKTKQKIRKAFLGKKRLPFSEEHKQNLSKACLGKNHKPLSEEHKQKLSNSLKGKKRSKEHQQKLCESWQPNNKRLKSKNGIHNGIHYQSSYELNFMKFLDEYKIPYDRADNKQFRVKYVFEDNEHYYYPDFYLPRENSIVELKASWQLKDLKTQAKLNAVKNLYGGKFMVITEQELPELQQ